MKIKLKLLLLFY